MKKAWHIIEKIFGIFRWHPTVALKYLPIVDKLNSLGLVEEELLEVGSGGLGITPYLKKKVVGVDIDFSQPLSAYLTPVKASVMNLPFSNNSFSIVISCDMLEHLKSSDRNPAIYQLLRVTNKLLCIAVPCGIQAQQHDESLVKFINNSSRSDFDFLSEHLQFGLPEKDWLIKSLTENARKLNKVIEIENTSRLNIKVRYFLMRGWMSDNFLVNVFFRKVLLLAIPLLKTLNTPPCYREFFFVKIQKC